LHLVDGRNYAAGRGDPEGSTETGREDSLPQAHRRPPMSSARVDGQERQGMTSVPRNLVVHLELRTGNLPRACAFYTQLFGWRAETIHSGSRNYLSLELGDLLQGGIVEHDTERALWLPYVEVADVGETTERARLLGASLLLPPREGPAGWRSILGAPAGGTIALWQPKA
jgi:predicted enzyme related to lactoylglutathione lyase